MKTKITIALLIIAAFSHAQDATKWSIAQVSLTPSKRLPSNAETIYGVRLPPWFGINERVYGIDLGFNAVAMDFKGAWAFIHGGGNRYEGIGISLWTNMGRLSGISLSGVNVIGCVSKNGVNGLACALLVNHCKDVNGILIGGYNQTAKMHGVQLGLINNGDYLCSSGQRNGSAKGIQIGFVNKSMEAPYASFRS